MSSSLPIVVHDFCKNYGATPAVSGLSFSVAPGQILGLLGPNGAGKTTTLRALAGILKPTQGQLAISGHDLETDALAAKAFLAYVPDEPKLFDQLTVWEHLRFVARLYRVHDWTGAAGALLDRFELQEKRDTLAAELSRGMRQKVAICCGYLHEPGVVLLDEPLTGLDPRGIRTMKDSIMERAGAGVAFIVSSHLLSLVEDLCTSLLILRKGRQVLHTTLAELRQQVASGSARESLEDLFFRMTEGTEPPATPPEIQAPAV